MELKPDLTKQTLAFTARPLAQPAISRYIESDVSATLKQFCTSNALDYGILWRWIKANPERLKEYEDALEARKAMQEDLIMLNLIHAATLDPRKVFKKSGAVKNIRKIPDEIVGSITELATSTDLMGNRVAKVKFVSRHQATKDLSQFLGLQVSRTEVTGKGGEPLLPVEVNNDTARRIAFLLSQATRDLAAGG